MKYHKLPCVTKGTDGEHGAAGRCPFEPDVVHSDPDVPLGSVPDALGDPGDLFRSQ
jgi:hypothetical protein